MGEPTSSDLDLDPVPSPPPGPSDLQKVSIYVRVVIGGVPYEIEQSSPTQLPPLVSEDHETLDDLIRRELVRRLAKLGGSKPAVAESLGVSLKTVYNWCRKYGLGEIKVTHRKLSAREYTDVMWCDICREDTEQLVHDAGHERDSSGDWQECQVCKSYRSGLTGLWRTPDPAEPVNSTPE